MSNISNSTLRPFLLAASLALAIPGAGAAGPATPEAGGCDAMDGKGRMGRHAGHQSMIGEFGPGHLRGLNLSEEQRDKVFAIMHAQAPEMRDKAKALRGAQEQLRLLSASADFDEGKARALSDELGRATFEATLVRARAERQIQEILTPEQRQQLAERRAAGPRRMMKDAPRPAAG